MRSSTTRQAAGRGAVRTLWTLLSDPTAGYKTRLANRICSVCEQPFLSTALWLKFDAELRLMAAVAVAEGRTDTRLARLVGWAIALASDSRAASRNLLHVLTAQREQFIAAIALVGVRNPSQNVTAFQFRHINAARPLSR